MKYDLHMHSTFSDGADSPESLILQAKGLGLDGISITDHDTVAAYSPTLFAYAKEQEIELITGVEFSTVFEKIPVHILGYCIDIENKGLSHLIEMHAKRRKERNEEIVELLKRKGFFLQKDEIAAKGTTSLGRPHIAMVMIEKGYVATIAEAFQNYIGDGKPCWAPGKPFSIAETIQTIKEAGGKAVLAHPILLKRKNFIKKVAAQGFDGMECYYARFSHAQCEEMVRIAERYNLCITGGSDYHGGLKEFNQMGSAYTNEESLGLLRA